MLTRIRKATIKRVQERIVDTGTVVKGSQRQCNGQMPTRDKTLRRVFVYAQYIGNLCAYRDVLIPMLKLAANYRRVATTCANKCLLCWLVRTTSQENSRGKPSRENRETEESARSHGLSLTIHLK